MTPLRSRTGLYATAVAVLAAVCLMFGGVGSISLALADNAEVLQQELAGIAVVLAGPAGRNNKVQARLVLEAVTAREDVVAAAVINADGSIFATSGTVGNAPGGATFAVGDTEKTLRVAIREPEAAPAPTGLSEHALRVIVGVLALLAGIAGAASHARYRHRASAQAARNGFSRELDQQKQMFSSLTEAYNELVIDHTVHTHQRQLERRRFFADIERQKAELIEARDAALAEALARSRFFAGMTHELRTPMNAIMGFSEAIEKQIFGPDQMDRYSDYAHDIRISAQHLLDTINHLLDLAKAESGKLELDDENLDVAGIIDDCLGMLRRLAENAQVSLSSHPGHELAPYRADRRILRQILINLISNAIKFTPADGEVLIEAHADAADDLVISVSDNGRGIDPDDLVNVFEPFVQGRIQGAGPGTGLGLPLSRTFARLHGGELVIESTVGQGTKASLLLPSWRWRRGISLEQTSPPPQPNGNGSSPQQQVASLSDSPPQTNGSLSAQLK
jgi:signal transduction histidine kinase